VAIEGGLSDRDAAHILEEMLDLMTATSFKHEVGELPLVKNTVTQISKIVETNRSLLK